jgi:hypothetical protein
MLAAYKAVFWAEGRLGLRIVIESLYFGMPVRGCDRGGLVREGPGR